MESDTLNYEIDTEMVDELLGALDMMMPGAEVLPPMSSFQDVIQATFQWTNVEANGNMNIMFPTCVDHGLPQTNNPAQARPFQQQQQLPHAVPNNSSCSPFTFTTGMSPTNIGYDSNTAAAAGAAPKASPFAGIHISSIIQQPAAVPLVTNFQIHPGAAITSPAAAASSLPAAVTPAAAAAAAAAAQSKQQTSPAADSSSDCAPYMEWRQQQQQQQVRGKRGRPQKVHGRYSKGYTSILKYRQRKKDMVLQMEQEVAAKLAQLKRLQEQQQQLLDRATMLERSVGAQEALLTQMAELRLSVGPEEPDSSATDNVLMQPQQQQQLQQQQIDGVTVPDALPELLQRYQQYIKDAAAALAAKRTSQQQQQQDHGSTSSSSNSCTGKHGNGSSSFPHFPFSIVDTLALWQVNRVAGVPPTTPPAANSSSSSSAATAAAAATGEGSCEGASDARILNLNTWLHDAVPADQWKQIAQQLNIRPQQRQQLAAAWQLYVAAVQKLNKERQQLVQQLQLLLQTGSSDMPTAAAAQKVPDSQAVAAAAAAPAGCTCTPLSGAEFQGYVDVSAAVEWNLVRGRAMVMLFGWSMMCALDSEQVGILCVGAWPHFPLLRAVVAHVLAEEKPSSCL